MGGLVEGLRESVDLEARADLMAAACQFGEAAELMRRANALRSAAFGRGLDPNELRALAHSALGPAQGEVG